MARTRMENPFQHLDGRKAHRDQRRCSFVIEAVGNGQHRFFVDRGERGVGAQAEKSLCSPAPRTSCYCE